MRVTLSKNDSYEMIAEIKKIECVDRYQLTIMSYFQGAKNPEWRTQCRVITKTNNLRCLMLALACEVIECEC